MSEPNAMLSALKEHFPDAELVGIVPGTFACRHCRREATTGLTIRRAAICTTCAPHVRGILKMRELPNTLENEALEAGGRTGGAYLDSIDKTDLAVLEPEEWAEFLRQVLEGYSEHMREEARKAPPF